jgi:FAD/FMN-containing dehydrogenase
MLDVVRPGDPTYAAVRHVYTATGSPAEVLLPRDTAEVAEALAVARASGLPLAIRSGGHGISSISTNQGGVVIDLRRLDRVEHLGGASVLLGPGARWGRVARTLEPWGLAISSGDSGDVGVGGLATTGGVGLMARAHGLTIDRLRRATVVLADSSTHTVSATEEPDLFWAVRGAGANVGVVTSFELEAARTPVVAQATLAYRLSDPAGFLERWGRAVEAAPRAVSAFLYVFGGPEVFAQATVVVASDDPDVAVAGLEPFAALPGLVGQRAALVPYADVPMTSGAPHAGHQTAATHSGFVDHLDAATAAALVAGLRSGFDMVQIRSVGGAVNDVPADATAYAHRHQQLLLTPVSAAGPGPRFEAAWEPVHAHTDGMYLSFETDHGPDAVAEAFPPATLARLRAIKRRVDPDRVFVQNFDVSETVDELGAAAG